MRQFAIVEINVLSKKGMSRNRNPSYTLSGAVFVCHRFLHLNLNFIFNNEIQLMEDFFE